MSDSKKYRALIFFKDGAALDRFLCNFLEANITRSGKQILYKTDHMEITCIEGLSDNMRGNRADYIAVQEELTWRENWPEIMEYVLKPMLVSQALPVDIQIFDGNDGGVR